MTVGLALGLSELKRTYGGTDGVTYFSIYDDQRAVLSDYQSVQSDVLAHASYQRFYRRLVEAAPWVLGLGIKALLLLVVFSAAVQKRKDEPKPTIVLAPIELR